VFGTNFSEYASAARSRIQDAPVSRGVDLIADISVD
jgi:hypothetical protein